MGAVLGFDPALTYEERTGALLQHQVALWSSLASDFRPDPISRRPSTPSVSIMCSSRWLTPLSDVQSPLCSAIKGLLKSHLPVLLHVGGPAYGGVWHRSPKTGQITGYEPDNSFTPDMAKVE